MYKLHVISRLSLFLGFIISFSACNNATSRREEVVQKKEETQSNEKKSEKTILFFGDSMSAGYGVDQEEAFPALIQDKIDSLELDYKVINGGLSGETSASGLSRIDWFLEDEPTIFILELGGNDGLRGIQLSATKENLQAILDKVKNKYPNTQLMLAGMQIPPNMGEDYTSEFKKIYPELAQNNDLILIPFLLEGVGGNPELNQPDGIHPTIEGHKIVAETVWKHLSPIL
ncbi:arylesterase [Echinicola sp. CAU 1574]|uniref:Arylesterase n=1 Tax=Echinicola arenosa TaxID=2774144 RepID=A0ABR9ALV1_9BACT|nr:arylesterase [Echinicola arenosa]MBD8489670.1 arylesterase [Echinicola arenosa]